MSTDPADGYPEWTARLKPQFDKDGRYAGATFMELAVLGVYDGIEAMGVQDWVAMWNQGHGGRSTLAEFLGMNPFQYELWAENPSVLRLIIEGQRKKEGIEV